MSHVEDKSKYLTNAQKASLKLLTKSAPNETDRAHVCNSYNFSLNKRTPQDPSSIRSAQRVVVKQRREIALRNTQGVKLDETNCPMPRLCNKIDFENLIAQHNYPANDYHLDLHSVVCLGAQWNKGNTFMETSTVDLILNVGLAIGSGCHWMVVAYTVGWHLCHVCIQFRRYCFWCQFPVRHLSTCVMVNSSE
jgi:hypothetical protein